MDSRFLRSLISVIDSGSIAEAARTEHLTAAAVSQRIKSLETEFGFELLCRVGHTATPTEACISIMPRARRIVNEVRLLAGDADSHGLTGTLRLGIIPSQVTPLFVSTLRTLGCHQPGIHISLSQNNSRNLYNSLVLGEIDGAIAVEPAFELPKTVRSILLRTEPLVLVAQRCNGMPINEQLKNNRYIEYQPDPFVGHSARKYLDDHAIDLKSTCDTSSLNAIAMLVRDGVGVSLIPQWRGLENHYNGCAVTPINDERYTRKIVLMTSKLTDRPGMIEKLLEILSV